MKFGLPKFFANKPPVLEDEHQLVVFSFLRQAALAGWSDLALAYHTPNGGGRSKGEGARMKSLGVKPGVSDIFLPVPRNGKHGLWIELKAEHGTPSPDQLDWIGAMLAQGYAAQLAWGWQEAVTAIAGYMDMNLELEG